MFTDSSTGIPPRCLADAALILTQRATPSQAIEAPVGGHLDVLRSARRRTIVQSQTTIAGSARRSWGSPCEPSPGLAGELRRGRRAGSGGVALAFEGRIKSLIDRRGRSRVLPVGGLEDRSPAAGVLTVPFPGEFGSERCGVSAGGGLCAFSCEVTSPAVDSDIGSGGVCLLEPRPRRPSSGSHCRGSGDVASGGGAVDGEFGIVAP